MGQHDTLEKDARIRRVGAIVSCMLEAWLQVLATMEAYTNTVKLSSCVPVSLLLQTFWVLADQISKGRGASFSGCSSACSTAHIFLLNMDVVCNTYVEGLHRRALATLYAYATYARLTAAVSAETVGAPSASVPFPLQRFACVIARKSGRCCLDAARVQGCRLTPPHIIGTRHFSQSLCPSCILKRTNRFTQWATSGVLRPLIDYKAPEDPPQLAIHRVMEYYDGKGAPERVLPAGDAAPTCASPVNHGAPEFIGVNSQTGATTTIDEIEESKKGWFAYFGTRNFWIVLVLGYPDLAIEIPCSFG